MPKTEVDAQEGGRFLIVMQAGDQKIPHTCTYLKISPPSQLAESTRGGL